MKKLKYRNNWEAHVYTLDKDGETIKSIKSVTVNGQKFKVKSYQDHRSYSDHGHRSEVTTPQFFIEDKTEKLGVTVQVTLGSLKNVMVDEKDVKYI